MFIFTIKPIMRCHRWRYLAAVLCVALSPLAAAVKLQLPLNTLRLPKGFSIALYTTDRVAGPRQLTLSHGKNSSWPNASIVYVGSSNESTVSLPCMTG